MPPSELQVTVEARAGGVTVIRVAGSVDHAQYYKMEEAIQTQLDRKVLRLVVDLSQLSYISSAGINTLGHALSQYERVNGKLCYIRPAQTAQWHFFTMIGVDVLFPWAATLDEALQRVSA